MSFTHLQVKSGYSLMESTITIDKLVKKAADLNFQALALTDDHVLYGAIPFYKACKSHGIKPIIGINVQVIDEHTEEITCILLAKNNQGYKQLMKLSTDVQLSDNKNIEFAQLNKYTQDLIGIVSTTSKEIGIRFENQSFEEINEYLAHWKQAFAGGDFYLSVEDHGKERDKTLHQKVQTYSIRERVNVVAVNDVRYLDQKDDHAYDCLQAIKKGQQWVPTNNPSVPHHHLRSSDEMDSLFGLTWPEVIEATNGIVEKCNVELNFDERLLPSFAVPEEMDAHTYLEKQCFDNLETKFKSVSNEVKERLKYELSVIKSMGFSDYFLIVWDFINYAKRNDIVVGPGRGSAAGSLVAYVLSITDVDPIKHQLLFERFLNPERITMPDIDIDFSDNRRDEVIDYVRDKYGVDHVAQIITFGTFAARSLVRELIKTIGIDQQDAYFLLKEIPIQANKSLLDYIQASEDLKKYIKQSASLKALFTIALKLEGLPRHVSTHAAGVVISEKPLVEHIPLTIGSSHTLLTQYPMNELESVGLLKMDFLGLRNLTLLERVIKSIGQTQNKQLHLDEIPESDEETFNLLQSGMTDGIFQLESEGMKQVLTKLKPTSFEDIVAVNALYRPGPMENIPTYISRKHNQSPIHYPHPDLEPILKKTYGVLIYQEQIMQIASHLAGFSLGKADILRRAVSKKQHELMDEQRETFIAGCLNNGYDEAVAIEIFDWIVQFSNYGFNRSHAVAYSKISYQLAYLKAHYPASFFAELLSTSVNQQEKVHHYRKEAKDFKLEFLPPNINNSFGKYTVEHGQIRMGLLSIKGIGNQAVKEIVRARKSGPFKSIFDFCLRISTKLINRQSMELLIMVGAFDDTYHNRASLLATIDHAMEQGELFREFADQPSLFQDKMDLEVTYVEIEDFSLMKKLADEKELVGIYISSHPLASYREKLRMSGYLTLNQANRMVGKRNVKSAVIIQSMKTIRTKRGDPMAFVTIGDETSEMEAVIFPDVFREVNRWLNEEVIILITGKIELRNNKNQWLVQEIHQFNEEDVKAKANQRLFVKFSEQNSEKVLLNMKEIAINHPGNTPVIIHREDKKQTYQLASEYFMEATRECLQELKGYFGEANVVLKKE
ncbi:DNA polymerase III subunit alpha [Virgibacillus necropolis]|uniref:DNA polymerase III subunit alpha n=1 Tax=Virgibacillus necropolis TaxID=163877 RepID=A0A221MBJ4_9BACI|nr:DNA polymerase III subunit alpha [Virgibacillus necropolis]ASN05011.1 DNA polymerase III subunit alpha [Virgibacillus necropolis]